MCIMILFAEIYYRITKFFNFNIKSYETGKRKFDIMVEKQGEKNARKYVKTMMYLSSNL